MLSATKNKKRRRLALDAFTVVVLVEQKARVGEPLSGGRRRPPFRRVRMVAPSKTRARSSNHVVEPRVSRPGSPWSDRK
jgi:hypothetical protein